jgi:hypothetical protein
MRKNLFGLMALALLGGNSLLAQTAAPAPMGTAGAYVAAPVVMVEPCGVACCPTKTVCVPEQYMKKTTKVVYSSGCEPLCLCYFHGFFKGCGCDSGHCERPYTRRYLIKKIETCEECATKCVPAQVPTCEHGRCH